MKGISFAFLLTGVIAVTLGMIWGIQMSATGDHTLSPAHAHLNLIGFVVMVIYAIYYHLTPQAAGRLARAHFALSLAAVVVIVPGIAMAISGVSETAAKIGSILVLLSMLTFLYTVARNGFGARTA